jgi:hypothetical protein
MNDFLLSYSHFLQTLKAHANETAEKNGKTVLNKCVLELNFATINGLVVPKLLRSWDFTYI